MPVTRRSFLTSLGAIGGAGALYGAMGTLGLAPAASAATPAFRRPSPSDFALSGRSAASVVVLGGGIAGMTTAYELGRAGYDVTILEARQRPGGRNWTVRSGTTETDLAGETQRSGLGPGQYLNAGPARLPQHHVTLDYCRELGVAIEPFVNQNADAYVHYTTDATGEAPGATAASGRTVRQRTAKADTYGYVSELLSKATDRGALDDLLSAPDKEALLDFLTGFGDLGAAVDGDPLAYTGSGRRGYAVEPGAGLVEGTTDAPFSRSDVLRAGLGRSIPFELGWDQAMMMFQPVGGMDRIAYAFEQAVGVQKFRYGATVTGITTLPAGVEVAYTDAGGAARVARADYAVCTLPPHIAARIPSNLGAEVTASLAHAVPVSTGKIGLEYDRRWWELEDRTYGGITNTDLDLSTIWYPSSGFHGERGVVVGYYNFGGNADSYADVRHRVRLERALAGGTAVHGPKYAQGVTSSFSVAWRDVAHSEGGWVSWPDQTGPEYRRLLEPTGNVHFAGDHLSHAIAWQHGAIVSARAAVTALHERVMSA